MTDVVEFLTRGVLIGVGGSALMDVWALIARRAFNRRGLDYALLEIVAGSLQPTGRPGPRARAVRTP